MHLHAEKAPWSSGQDETLSRSNPGFDPRWGHQMNYSLDIANKLIKFFYFFNLCNFMLFPSILIDTSSLASMFIFKHLESFSKFLYLFYCFFFLLFKNNNLSFIDESLC